MFSKVETINDSYMVASGLPEKNGDLHAAEIANLAIALQSITPTIVVRATFFHPKEPSDIPHCVPERYFHLLLERKYIVCFKDIVRAYDDCSGAKQSNHDYENDHH